MTLDSAITAAIITAVVTVSVHWLEARVNRQKMLDAIDRKSEMADAAFDKVMSVYAARTDEKLEELTREVREHNNFARRMPVVEEQVKQLNDRLDRMGK